MNAVDLYLLKVLNNFAHRSNIFDASVSFLADQALLKGGLLTAVLWLAWFRPDPTRPEPKAASRVGHFNTCGDNHVRRPVQSHQVSSAVSVTTDP
jgi:hypothetical protein